MSTTLDGVLLERVIRDVRRDVLSVTQLGRSHAVTRVVTIRDLVLIDLLVAPWIPHGVQIGDVAGRPPYDETQRLAARLASLIRDASAGSLPAPPDGILYGSRFGAMIECVAIWDRAANALEWQATSSLTADQRGLAEACLRLGIGLVT